MIALLSLGNAIWILQPQSCVPSLVDAVPDMILLLVNNDAIPFVAIMLVIVVALCPVGYPSRKRGIRGGYLPLGYRRHQ
jgi:hypothetical protein